MTYKEIIVDALSRGPLTTRALVQGVNDFGRGLRGMHTALLQLRASGRVVQRGDVWHLVQR
jgi:hypothetical protein